MLQFIDSERYIRVYRTGRDGAGRTKREAVGRVDKRTYEVSAELAEAIQPPEAVALQRTIEMYREAAVATKRAALLSFPVTVREVLEYAVAQGSEAEKDLVEAALREGMNQLRKASKSRPATPGGGSQPSDLADGDDEDERTDPT